MRHLTPLAAACVLLLGGLGPCAHAAGPQPDPLAVQRFGPAYRYPQSGWTVVHIEGEPYERGVQHGRLLGPEIEGYIRALAAEIQPEAAADSWRLKRSYLNAMFLRRFNQEQILEMQGIAHGAAAVGARYDERPVDLLDILMINMSAEVESIDQAMSATPNGLEEFQPPVVPEPPRPATRSRTAHCCAFAANGAATRDGKVVFGHITMWDLRSACYFNIWMDLQPAAGHRFVMQTVPGGIYSTMDYSISDTGLMMGETNISQTTFEMTGTPLASRVRQATQYAESLEQAAAIMIENNNGLGTAEWVMADLKRNEIALLVLGTRESKLFRSSKQEWIDGAEGFYWSCNNSKSMPVRLESMASMKSFPAAIASISATKMDRLWLQLYDRNKGHIDSDFAHAVFRTPELVSSHATDAVFTTTELGLKLQTWACFGPPIGVIRMPSFADRQQFPEIRPLVVNPWTVLDAKPPAAPADPPPPPAADLHDPVAGGFPGRTPGPDGLPPLQPLWHCTLLPEGDGDIWLSNGFANYHALAMHWNHVGSQAAKSGFDARAMDGPATGLFYYRSLYETGAHAGEEQALAAIHADYRSLASYQVAIGKGVLLLHSLRGLVGGEKFDRLMDEFGAANAGKAVSSRQFQQFIEQGTGRSWDGFFEAWLQRTGLPTLELGEVQTRQEGQSWHTQVTVRRNEAGAPLSVLLTVETADGETTETVRLENTQAQVEIVTTAPAQRVVLDKYRMSACANGPPFTALAFDDDLEHTLIIYGTLDEEEANHEAARMLQEVLRKRQHNIVVAIKADHAATEEELSSHHLILLGHPGTHALAARFRKNLPLQFGPHSFSLRGVNYASPDTAVLAAAENPLNRRFSLVLFAGLGTPATIRMVTALDETSLGYAPVILLASDQPEHDLVLTPEEFIREIPAAAATSK